MGISMLRTLAFRNTARGCATTRILGSSFVHCKHRSSSNRILTFQTAQKNVGFFSTQPFLQQQQEQQQRQQQYVVKDHDNSMSVYKNLRTPAAIVETHFDLSQIDPTEHDQILRDFIIIPDYLSQKEHDMLVDAATKKLKRALGKQVRYEDGHFDGVITRYRECSASDWGAPAESSSSEPGLESGSQEKTTPQQVMQSVKNQFFPSSWRWVSPHILELESGKGGIKPHVDHLDASGEVVAGFCLGSTAVMELIHIDDPKRQFRVLLPKGCFYFQRDSVRYHFKHGIPIAPEDHTFKGTVIPKEKRISVMLRNALNNPSAGQHAYKM